VIKEKILGLDTNFEEFLDHYKAVLANLFSQRSNLEEISLNRGLPPFVLRDIMSCKPLSVFIDKEYEGRGGNVSEALSVLEATSYESLPLSLMVGINGALFLQPVGIYGSTEAKDYVLGEFLNDRKLGGLMITEPDYGSDALKMKTSFTESEEHYHLKGTKHWAGLTGWADFWLLTARRTDDNGDLGRDIDFFIHDTHHKGVEVTEVYQNLGLYMLPYGRNEIDAKIPKAHRLIPKTNGITMMLDILHRSRLQFPGMGIGFIRRLLDEAIAHCKERFVGGSSLLNYDQVVHRISNIQSYYTVLSAMCTFTSEHAGVHRDLSRMDVAANTIKTVVTDYMQQASQSLLQLVGAKGYRLNHLAGRAVVDSRPYQIFEGSNDILYQQLSESILKLMRKTKVSNLYEFLKGYELSENAADMLKDTLNFSVDLKIAQRKLVQLGKILGRVISLNMVIELGQRGFRSDMIDNAIENLKAEIHNLNTSFQIQSEPGFTMDYQAESSWLNYTRTV